MFYLKIILEILMKIKIHNFYDFFDIHVFKGAGMTFQEVMQEMIKH